jgi:hypothetical protein
MQERKGTEMTTIGKIVKRIIEAIISIMIGNQGITKMIKYLPLIFSIIMISIIHPVIIETIATTGTEITRAVRMKGILNSLINLMM